MKATLLFSDKEIFEDGSIIEIRVWSVPLPVPPSRHQYKYSLYYGSAGERLVGFDNERGKGDHAHILGVESPYVFNSLTDLLNDFQTAVEAIRGKPI